MGYDYRRAAPNTSTSVVLIKSGLWLIACWAACFFINMFFLTCYLKYGAVMCYAFGFCSVGASVCIYADFTHKLGSRMRRSDDSEEKIKKQQHFGAIVGLVPTAINYVYVILLYLSKLGAWKFDFYPYYKTLTTYFIPLSYIVAPNKSVYVDGVVNSISATATELSWGAMILFTLLPLIFVITTWAAYYVGYNHIDLKEKIVYKR